MDTAETLRTARLAAGLTQAELAERAGTAQPTIARYEAGRSEPRVATLVRLLEVCGVSLLAVDVPPAHGRAVERLRGMTVGERLESWSNIVALRTTVRP